ncbi:uncharacterized protein TRIADDRAFT_62381 [Trichoplax adhaerens]|uniref:Uncharacterized protein n=1 Tax=Trichoplax adhaerens TaxID=10228 RepID=B3SDM4_TRIAD|nr:predicted protein [Trichoplax adhaerens]EDV19171.1 predicted protein [Trichoplax adhaerens]|eukprot:XP_002118349.1 predicted protein [Trichoplax adhaerens]
MAAYSDLNIITENSPLHILAIQCHQWETEDISITTFMSRLETLQNNLNIQDGPNRLHLSCTDEMQMLTYCSNLPCLQSTKTSDAELKINLLLNHMMSPSSWVRCVTCSLLRNLWLTLDSCGKHFIVQTTILCKNLMIALNDSLSKKSVRFDTSVCICLASLTIISSSAIKKLSSLRLSRPFVALSIATILDVLNHKFDKVNNPSSILIYRVAADSLERLIHVSNLWLEALNVTQCYQCIQSYYEAIITHFQIVGDDWTCCKILGILNHDDVFSTFASQSSILSNIATLLTDALKPYKDGDLLELRWAILHFIMRYAKLRLGNHLMHYGKLDRDNSLTLIKNGCCEESQVKKLKEYLASLPPRDDDS